MKAGLWVLCLVLVGVVPAGARQTPIPDDVVRGITWDIPADFRAAAEDLIEMNAVGVSAVRTGFVRDRQLLRLADSLGIVLYRELPYYARSAAELKRVSAEADSLVALLAADSRLYASAGPIGLVRQSNTDHPVSCEWLSQRKETAGQAAGGNLPVYYVSIQDRPDACASSVDFVLLDLLGQNDPLRTVRAWTQDGSGAVGIGLLGTPVHEQAIGESDRSRGTRQPGSPEYQARYFENVLGALSTTAVTAVFIHRWRDPGPAVDWKASYADVESGRLQHLPPEPLVRNYGLYDGGNNPRPALQIVRGFYRGSRVVFSLPKGQRPAQPDVWYVLTGWMLIGVVVLVYATSPRLRMMIPRYFISHGFYRHAVREAREVLPLTSTGLLTVLALVTGMLGTQVATTFRHADAMQLLLMRSDPLVRSAATALLDAPIVLMILIGSTSILLIALWMGIWTLTVRLRSPLLPSQALMLAVWPRWFLLVLLPVSMVVQTLGSEGRTSGALVLVVLWAAADFWASVRTAVDLSKVTRVPRLVAFLVWLLNPFVVVASFVVGWALVHPDLAGYLIRLAAD